MSEGRFHSQALDMIRPGALPTPPPPYTHLPSPDDEFLLLLQNSLVGLHPTESNFPWLWGHFGPWPRLQEGVPRSCSQPQRRRNQLPPSSRPSSLAVGKVPKGLMRGVGGGQWGLDGWLCFFICAIVWTILKLHVKEGISI